MADDGPTDLVECTFVRDYVKLLFSQESATHKPIKLHKVDESGYAQLKEDSFWGLAHSYDLKDDIFEFSGMDESVRIRFIGLLASLTLHYFSKSSKETYHVCLDLRGLEWWSDWIRINPPDDVKEVSMNGFEGKLSGRPEDKNFYPYCTYYGREQAYLYYCVRKFDFFNSARMRFKTVYFVFDRCLFVKHGRELYTTLMTPRVENVQMFFEYCQCPEFHPKSLNLIQLADLRHFFNACKNVKRFHYHYSDDDSTHDFSNYTFAQLKEMIEKWSFSTTKLESFSMDYYHYDFQLHNHKLKKCVVIENEWFLTDNCDMQYVENRSPENHRLGVKHQKYSDYYNLGHDVDGAVDHFLSRVDI